MDSSAPIAFQSSQFDMTSLTILRPDKSFNLVVVFEVSPTLRTSHTSHSNHGNIVTDFGDSGSVFVFLSDYTPRQIC